MTTLSEEQREKLGLELTLLSRAAAPLVEAMQPLAAALEGISGARDMVLERYGVSDPLGACEACERLLFEGDEGHRCGDGPILCADHAPSWGDLRKQLTEPSVVDDLVPDLDAEDDDGIVRRDKLAAIEAHVVSGGSLEDKIIHPL